jgi:FkbM family methyltransferase
MKPLRRHFKRWLYSSCPSYKGVFPYFGEQIHFPPGSLMFELAMNEGIFEAGNLKLLQAALRPGSWAFDVGANIGLMSAPLLHAEPTLHVVSIEASPRTAEFLARTIAASPNRHRWTLVPKALGAVEGEIEFFAATGSDGIFDGLKDTGRSRGAAKVQVSLTTLDAVWRDAGRPAVCLVKIDVEGAETEVLQGGRECLRTTRPIVLLEWNRLNLAAYGRSPDQLLTLAAELNCDLLNAPGLAPVTTPASLLFQTGVSETFLLVPRA